MLYIFIFTFDSFLLKLLLNEINTSVLNNKMFVRINKFSILKKYDRYICIVIIDRSYNSPLTIKTCFLILQK